MSRDAVAVRIAGHEYRIRSDGEPDALREIAGYVDRAMNQVRDRTGTVDSLDVAVLTCLNLAREILALRTERRGDATASVDEDRLRSLIERVEAAANGAVPSDGDAARDDSSVDALADDEASSEVRTLELPAVERLLDRQADGPSGTGARADEATAGPPAERRMAAGAGERGS